MKCQWDGKPVGFMECNRCGYTEAFQPTDVTAEQIGKEDKTVFFVGISQKYFTISLRIYLIDVVLWNPIIRPAFKRGSRSGALGLGSWASLSERKTSSFSQGQGRTPVLGVRLSDALAFCAWLTESDRSNTWQYRLPRLDEQKS